MDFNFTDEQKMLRGLVKEFVDGEIRPVAQKIDEDEEIPIDLIKKIGEMGFLGLSFPEEYGGGGFGELGYCIMQEEMTRACNSTAVFIGAHQSIGTNAIYLGGSEEIKKKILASTYIRRKNSCIYSNRTQHGSDTFNLSTKAELVGDKWILNGNKVWITNAGTANVFSVFARTDKGISAFVVDADTPGIIIGAKEKKLGIRGSITNTVTFENVGVPKENLLHKDGKGFLIAMKTLDAGRIGLGAGCLGASKELLENFYRVCKTT